MAHNTLLGKGLLVAHLFFLLMAHYRCATSTTPLVFFTNGVGVLGTGVPRLACLRPAAWLKGGPSTAHLHQHRPKTLVRGQASRGGRHGASSGTASSGWLVKRRGDQGGVPHDVPVTQAMTTKGARRAPAAQCPPFLFGAKGASAGESIKQMHPFRCNETKTSPRAGRKSLWSPSQRHHQSLWQARTNSSQDKCTRCSPSKWPIVGTLPAQYLEEAQGLCL